MNNKVLNLQSRSYWILLTRLLRYTIKCKDIHCIRKLLTYVGKKIQLSSKASNVSIMIIYYIILVEKNKSYILKKKNGYL